MTNDTGSKEITVTRYRGLTGAWKTIVPVCVFVALGCAIFYMFNLSLRGTIFTETGYFYTLMAFLLPWAFIFLPATKKAREALPWYDLLAALLCFVIPFYLFLTSYQALLKGWETIAPSYVRIMCLVLIILVVEAARRSTGLIFAIICLFFGFFPLFASQAPMPFTGIDFSFWRIVSFHVMGIESFLGIPMRVVGTLLLGFMIFAVALQAVGGGMFFTKLALSTVGRVRGGAAKISVVASALFGSISGSAVANVLVDGPFTIPTMKGAGYPDYYAAAVEATASTGGVLMPPVMGAAAFLIAQFLRVSYIEVCIAAAIPSLLYYLGLFLQADAFAAKSGLKGLPREALPSFRQTLKGGWFFIVAFIALTWFLFYLKMEARAPFYATAVLFLLSLTQKENRLTWQRFVEFLKRAGQILSDLMVVMLAIGLIIGSLTMTGVAHGFSSAVVSMAGGNVALLLVFGAATSFILGMGMSVTACYLFLAILLAPALVAVGLDPMAVHLFVLYWGMISFITPPVAVAAITAAGIIGASPWKTGFQAMRLAIVIYFVPFFFVIEPALILHGSVSEILIAVITAILGVVLIAGGVEGYMWGVGKVNWLIRLPLIVSGVLLAYPHLGTSAIGAIGGAALIFGIRAWRHLKQRQAVSLVAANKKPSGSKPKEKA